MNDYRQKITMYKIQYKDSDGQWRDMYSKSYTYWQSEMIVGYYITYKNLEVRAEEVEVKV